MKAAFVCVNGKDRFFSYPEKGCRRCTLPLCKRRGFGLYAVCRPCRVCAPRFCFMYGKGDCYGF